MRIEADENGRRCRSVDAAADHRRLMDKDGRPRPSMPIKPLLRIDRADVIIVAIGQGIESRCRLSRSASRSRAARLQRRTAASMCDEHAARIRGRRLLLPVRRPSSARLPPARSRRPTLTNTSASVTISRRDVEIPAPHLTNMPACGRIELRSRRDAERARRQTLICVEVRHDRAGGSCRRPPAACAATTSATVFSREGVSD